MARVTSAAGAGSPASDTQRSRATPVPEPPRLGRRIALAAVQTIATRFVLRGIGLVSTLILVRLLAPADFGVVSLASAVYAILDLLTQTGFTLAIVRMTAPQRRHYDTAWTLGVIRGLLIALGLVLTSGTQARLMGDPRIAPLMWLLAGTAILQSLESARLIDCQRDLRFDRLMRYAIAGKLAGFCIVLPLAYVMRNAWPLLLSGFFARLVVIPYSYALAPYRPRLSLAAWPELFHFAKWLTLGNLAGVVEAQLMNFVLGHYVGLRAVGYYQVVRQLAALPISEIAAPIREPAFAGFSRLRHDIDALRRHFLAGLGLQCVVILPLSAGVAVTAPDLVALFLGPGWAAAAPLLPAIALYALFDALAHYTHDIFVVLDRQRGYTIGYFATLVLRLPLTVWAAMRFGVQGAVLAMLASGVVNLVLWALLARPLLRFSWRDLRAAGGRSVLAAAVLSATVLLLGTALGGPAGGWWARALHLAAKVAIGAIAYGAALLLLWRVAGAPAESAEADALRGAANLFRQAGRATVRFAVISRVRERGRG